MKNLLFFSNLIFNKDGEITFLLPNLAQICSSVWKIYHIVNHISKDQALFLERSCINVNLCFAHVCVISVQSYLTLGYSVGQFSKHHV